MVAKPLCPLYKNIIKPLDRTRYPELRYLCIVIQKACKITCPVGEKNLPNWENKKA